MPVLSHFVKITPALNSRIVHLLKLVALLACLLACKAQAQLASLPSAGMELTRLEVLHDVPQGLTLAQVHTGQAGRFVAQPSLQIAHQKWDRALWIRLHLKALPSNASVSQASAVLALPTPYLDKVRLYTPGAQADAPWPVQQAGDFFAPQTWAMRGFHPKFLLPPPGAAAWQSKQELILYLQIDHLAPASISLELANADEILDRDVVNLMFYSLGIGMMLMIAVLTAAMARLHRDSIYAWYAAYAFFAGLASASHAGLAQTVLWPVGGYWPGTAVLSFLLLACACQLQFSLKLNAKQMHPGNLHIAAHATSLICLALALGMPIFTSIWQQLYYVTVVVLVSTMALSIILMLLGLRAGNRLAGVWLLSFVPLFGVVILAILEGVGILTSSYWSYSIAIYVAIIDVLILGIALQWFANERHGQMTRNKAMAEFDPLTGFVTAQAFQEQLDLAWQSSRTNGHHVAVAYVQLITRARNAQHLQLMLTRCVRILRTATGSQDVVARLEGSLLALLLNNAAMGDELNQRLSRIVALGLMPDRDDQFVNVLQFRIAATTRMRFKQSAQALDTQLRELLAQPAGWGSKPIRYIDHTEAVAPSKPPVLDSAELEETWDLAFKSEMSSSAAQSGSSAR